MSSLILYSWCANSSHMAKKAIKRRKVERKQAVIGVRCTESQKAALEAKAAVRGLGVSTWLLSLGMSAAEKP